ncbi:hypothetical protein [Pseudoduganella chitinolytica]|uniref:Uncharacterized protein n=1 Tax=Pseudoduganella chitinolytica TaxID=34070 RepID=A0ABY8BEA2_9BURK|nr:hypothetical protein [Pseudoduganella chitinolytica]WEF33306.1 hypothetical protein PX653_00505 [Pseudoduganella chitinolytica]
MNDQSPALVSLRIEFSPAMDEDKEARVTLNGSSTTIVSVSASQFADFDAGLAAVGAQTQQLPAGASLGGREGDRVALEFHADGTMGATIARPMGAETFTAPVSAAALARLADSVHQVAQAGEGTVDWTVAD